MTGDELEDRMSNSELMERVQLERIHAAEHDRAMKKAKRRG